MVMIKDGEYKLGQLSIHGYGRVVIPGHEMNPDLYDEMPIDMPSSTMAALFAYVKSRAYPITDFIALVKDNKIINIYE